MIEIGRLVVKIAGRDAGGKAIIVDVIDDNFVLIDGQARRRKCNIKHIEALDQVVKIKKGADHDSVISELKKLGIEVKEIKPKGEKPAKPKKQRKSDLKEKKPTAEKRKKEVKPKPEVAKVQNVSKGDENAIVERRSVDKVKEK